MKSKGNNVFMISVILLIIIGMAGLAILEKTQQNHDQKGIATSQQINQIKVNKVTDFDYSHQPSMGQSTAPVKVVEFGDFKCPICKRWHDEVLPLVKTNYIDTKKIQFYFINYQFIGADSKLAGEAGEAIYHQNPSSFWTFYDDIYKNQGDENVTWATQDFLLNMVKKDIKGINQTQFAKDLTNHTYLKDVLYDYNIGTKYGVNGTPSLFVNGTQVTDLTYSGIQTAIDEALKKAGKN